MATENPQLSRRPKFDSLEQQTFLELWRTYDRLKAIEESMFAEFEISSQQYNALRLLKAVSPASLAVSVLGQRLISRAPDMTRLLDRLEQRGWVERIRRDDNRRVVDVSITEAGKALLQSIAKPIRQCHQLQLGHMPPEQLTQLIELLKAVRRPHEQVTEAWPGND